ncbi:MAG: hypothetical protein ACLPKB_19695 [Xanthobacteraceae bacterium]
MIGITLSPEQIRTAPPEVRRWLEQELAVSLGLHAPESPVAQPITPHLVACTVEEAAQVLSLIQSILPVVNVFFELGREGGSAGIEGVEAFRLADILQHTRLQTLDQLAASLDAINNAFRRVRGDVNATLYGLDRRGYCFVARETQRSILRIWQEVVAERGSQVSVKEPNAEGAAPIERAFGPNLVSPSFRSATTPEPMPGITPTPRSSAATIAPE